MIKRFGSLYAGHADMGEFGFDTLWLAEHHFQPEGYECLPNLPRMAVHIAGKTERRGDRV